MSMDTDTLKHLLAEGRSICNVGQWTKAASAWVRRAHKRGEIVAIKSGWPDRRPAYIAA